MCVGFVGGGVCGLWAMVCGVVCGQGIRRSHRTCSAAAFQLTMGDRVVAVQGAVAIPLLVGVPWVVGGSHERRRSSGRCWCHGPQRPSSRTCHTHTHTHTIRDQMEPGIVWVVARLGFAGSRMWDRDAQAAPGPAELPWHDRVVSSVARRARPGTSGHSRRTSRPFRLLVRQRWEGQKSRNRPPGALSTILPTNVCSVFLPLILTVVPAVEVPARAGGSRLDLESRIRGRHRRSKNGISTESEP